MINPVFVNKDCFKSEFVPDRIIGREKQIKEIKRKINLELFPVIHIYGPSGSGKTAVIKHIFKNISNSVYVNCWERRTYRQIFDEILRRSNIVVHEKESRFSLLQKLRRVPKKVICLDNTETLRAVRFPILTNFFLTFITFWDHKKHGNKAGPKEPVDIC